MIIFNELRIPSTGDSLIIDTSIDTILEEDQDQLIEQIWVDNNPPVYVNGCPTASGTAILLATKGPLSSVTQDFVPIILTNEQTKHCRLEIIQSELPVINMTSDMLQIYILYSGGTKELCRCNPITSTVVNLYPLYRRTLYYMQQLSNNCEPPKELIDIILRIKSIDIAIRVGNYLQAFDLWSKLPKLKPLINPCGCNG